MRGAVLRIVECLEPTIDEAGVLKNARVEPPKNAIGAIPNQLVQQESELEPQEQKQQRHKDVQPTHRNSVAKHGEGIPRSRDQKNGDHDQEGL
jgi:hypothetical protein